jgi:four helix bundle protein
MSEHTPNKLYDLEERTFLFAYNVRSFIKRIQNSRANSEDAKQLIRSSASVAANYIEANDAFSKKEFIYRIKICKKESKESILFLRLLDLSKTSALEDHRRVLIDESTQLMKIFGAILSKSQ